jgi:hypothetical protein
MTPSEFAAALLKLIESHGHIVGLDVESASVIDEEPTVIGIDQADGPELMVEVNLA